MAVLGKSPEADVMSRVHVATLWHLPLTTQPHFTSHPSQRSPALQFRGCIMSDGITKEASPPFAFQPPAGGDIDLKSCNGTIFRAHSVLLGMASTVFSDMFANAKKTDTVELAEDAESISLMLAFIYPATLPSITTIELLEKSMLVAHKYDIQRITDFINQLFQPGNPLINLDPLNVFRVSSKYGFPSVRILASKSLYPSHYDFLSVDGLKHLAQIIPDSSHVVGLIGTQSARIKILDEVLLDKPLQRGIYPTLHSSASHSSAYRDYMSCEYCWRVRRVTFEGRYYYIPGWFYIWAIRLRTALLKKPINECDRYFNASCITGFEGTELEACSSCISSTVDKHSMFNAWGQSVKRTIEKELQALDVLYSL